MTHTLAVDVNSDDHVQGSADAPVTLVEYGDYQCPHCARAYPVVKAVQKALGGKLRFVFRNLPLTQAHPYAELAAESAEAAGAQGKFWEMHDALFEHQASLSPDLIGALAKKLGLDVPRFENELRERRFRSHVAKDATGAEKSEVNGTPSFFINGRAFAGDWTDPQAFASALTHAAHA